MSTIKCDITTHSTTATKLGAASVKVLFQGESMTFNPLQVGQLASLRIDAIEGSDTFTIESLPANFAGSLFLYGNRLQCADLIYPKMSEEDPYLDYVNFAVIGHYLQSYYFSS